MDESIPIKLHLFPSPCIFSPHNNFLRNLSEKIKFPQLLKCPQRVPNVATNPAVADTMTQVLNYFEK